MDHASGYLHIENQLDFSLSKNIQDKQKIERLEMDHGVVVDSYLSKNGIFHTESFIQYIYEHNKKTHYCGVNAHSQQ